MIGSAIVTDSLQMSLPPLGDDAPSGNLQVCFAEANGIIWELMQPVSGKTIMAEFLEQHGEGIHHIAFDCNGIPFKERLAGDVPLSESFSHVRIWQVAAEALPGVAYPESEGPTNMATIAKVFFRCLLYHSYPDPGSS